MVLVAMDEDARRNVGIEMGATDGVAVVSDGDQVVTLVVIVVGVETKAYIGFRVKTVAVHEGHQC